MTTKKLPHAASGDRDLVLDARLAKAFRELNIDLDDMRSAMFVLETVHEDACQSAPSSFGLKAPAGYRVMLPTEELDAALSYAMAHLGEIVRKVSAAVPAEIRAADRASYERSQAAPKTASPSDEPNVLDIEAPLRTALGLAKALRLMAENPAGDTIEAEPVYVLGRDIEAVLTTVEERWTALVDQRQAA